MPTYNKSFILFLILISILSIVSCGERVHESWVEPPAAPAYDDSTIFAKINSAVQSDPNLQGFDLKIEVNDGNVLLSGSVDNSAQAERVTMHSWIVDGVKQVDNQIAVKREKTVTSE